MTRPISLTGAMTPYDGSGFVGVDPWLTNVDEGRRLSGRLHHRDPRDHEVVRYQCARCHADAFYPVTVANIGVFCSMACAEAHRSSTQNEHTRESALTGTLALLAVALLSAACSSSLPTAPAPSAPNAIVAVTPAPVPTPAPLPPAPAPIPQPPPTPMPGPVVTPVTYYDATAGTAHWFGPPLFGQAFVIEVWPTSLWLHNTMLPIVQQGDGSIIARGPESSATLNLVTGQWSFNGLAGSAAGTLVKR